MNCSTSELPAIYVDFNNVDADGFVRLNTVGTTNDLVRLQIALMDGLRLCASDGDIAAEGTVRIPGSEGVWRLQVDWGDINKQILEDYDGGK